MNASETQYLKAWDDFCGLTAEMFEANREALVANPNIRMIEVDPDIDDLEIVELLMGGEDQFGVSVSDEAVATSDRSTPTHELTLGGVFALLVEAEPV